MALIARDKMNLLIPAAEAKAVAASAQDDIELAAVAYAINSTINTGGNSVIWTKPLRASTKTALAEAKYALTMIVQGTQEVIEISWR